MTRFNPWAARAGDRVRVTLDGRAVDLTVHTVYDDRSLAEHNGRTVLAWTRPGGFGLTIRPDSVDRYAAVALPPEE